MSLAAILRTALLGAGLLSFVACTTVVPSPSATPQAASPELVCGGQAVSSRPGAIDCREALALAITALPPDDRPIRAWFEYGTYCAATSGCGFTAAANRVDFGLVTFSYAGTTRQEYIYVVADKSGRPRLGGTLSSSPPPLMSIPTPIP
jgi:hypothetical protein